MRLFEIKKQTMILDKLENADWYFGCVPGFQKFMQFFNDNDLEELPACKIKLDGRDLIVNISDQAPKDEKDCKLEAHKDYIDIQIPLTATETMLWSSLEDCQNVIKEYDEGKDVELYGDKAAARFSVPKGYFAVFFPTDAHAAGMASSKFRKIIVKAKVE